MQKREAKFTTRFIKWLIKNWDFENHPAYFEAKSSLPNKNSIPFDAVSDKQVFNLQLKKFAHKFSDYDRLGTPFDIVAFSGKGYVVFYYHKRANKEFIMIPIDVFLKEKETSLRKSLLESRAKEIGNVYSLSIGD